MFVGIAIALLPDIVLCAVEDIYEKVSYNELERDQIKKTMNDRSRFLINYFKSKTTNTVDDVSLRNEPVGVEKIDEIFYDASTTRF